RVLRGRRCEPGHVEQRNPTHRSLPGAENPGLSVDGIEPERRAQPYLHEIDRLEHRKGELALPEPRFDGSFRALQRTIDAQRREGEIHEVPNAGRLGRIDQGELTALVHALDGVALLPRERRARGGDDGRSTGTGVAERRRVLQVSADQRRAEGLEAGRFLGARPGSNQRANRLSRLAQQPNDFLAEDARSTNDEVHALPPKVTALQCGGARYTDRSSRHSA